MRRAIVCLSLIGVVAWGHDAATAAGLDPASYYRLRVEAQRLAAAEDCGKAVDAYQQLTAAYDGDSATWFGLGGCLGRLGRWKEAAAAYERAYALGGWTHAETAHEIAGCWAHAGQTDSALVWLERSIALGYEDRAELLEQEDFTSLRGNERFERDANVLPKRTWTRDEGWRYDLEVLVAEMKRLHYTYSKAPLGASFDADVKTLHDKIPSLSDAGVLVAMQRLMTRLGDAHSSLFPTTGTRITFRRVPMQFVAFADGVWVTDAPDGLKDWIGVRVERVGSMPIEEVLRKLDPLISRDNPNALRVMGPYMLTYSTLLHELGVILEEESVPLSGIAPNGSRKQGAIPAAELQPAQHPHPPKLGPARFAGAPSTPRYLQRVQTHFWSEPIPADSLLYVQFNQVIDMPDLTLRQFALDVRKTLDTQPIRTLVVDVRHNNGGNSDLLTAFLRTLIHFETAGPGRRVYVLTGPYTFSAAQVFVSQVDRLTNAVFVGEPSGSRPNFIGEDTSLLLPWSKVRGSVSSRTHRVSSSDERYWIAPEVPVPATGADWLAGRDAAMDAVLQVVRNR